MSTIEDIGPAGCDYTQPQAWYDAHSGDITGDAGAPYIGEIEEGDYNALSMTSSTTDATHYFHLRPKTVDDAFRGTFSASVGPRIAGIIVSDDYTLLEHIIGRATTPATPSIDLTGANCILHGCGAWPQGSTDLWYGWGIRIQSNPAVVRCCAVHNLTCGSIYGNPATVYGIASIGVSSQIYHCTVRNIQVYDWSYTVQPTTAIGIRNDYSSDCIVWNSSVFDLTANNINYILWHASSTDVDYNAISGSEPIGANSQHNVDASLELEDTHDFHLKIGATRCVGTAGSLSGFSDPPDYDIDYDQIGNNIGVDSALETPYFHNIFPGATPGTRYIKIWPE